MVQDLHLTGSATFLQLPRLANELEQVPDDRELHVHIDQLDHIDHACLQLLSNWRTQRESANKPGMVVEWDELTERYKKALVGGARDEPRLRSVMSTIWAEWKRVYSPGGAREAQEDDADDFIDAERVRMQIDARSLDDVVAEAAEALANAAGRPVAQLRKALQERIEGHVALGGGVSVPHTPIDGLERSIAALVTTRNPVEVAGEEADVFFVLLAPAADPSQHLQSLAHVGRLCHEQGLLDALREASEPAEAVRLLRTVDRAVFDTGAFVTRARLLAAVEVEDAERTKQVAEFVEEAFGGAVSGAGDTEPFATVRRTLRLPATTNFVLVTVVERDLVVLLALLEEERRVVGGSRCRVHVLRPETIGSAEPVSEPATTQEAAGS